MGRGQFQNSDEGAKSAVRRGCCPAPRRLGLPTNLTLASFLLTAQLAIDRILVGVKD